MPGQCRLASVAWASDIVVLDSGSTDRTAELVARYPQARLVTRTFDSHSVQANFGLGLIESEWVLSLDADYILTPELQHALQKDEIPAKPDQVYFAPFVFKVHGRPLRASLMPPRAVLYRRQEAVYEQDGHTQRLSTAGRRPVLLTCAIIHDDRKPLARWLDSQKKYALLEAAKLKSIPASEMAAQDRLRRLGGWPPGSSSPTFSWSGA